ncbi:MAG: hypothetical protein ACI37Q_07515 [Candidatus Gastranaerophilaceae bacterium]
MLSPVGFTYIRPSVSYRQTQPTFGSIGSSVSKFPKEKFLALTDRVSAELPVNFSEYKFLLRNPIGFYIQSGKDVNNFLRRGTFDELPDITSVPEKFRSYIQNQNAEEKAFNRTIIESIEYLDKLMTSETTRPMVVYRDAPVSWLSTAKNGILTDKGYLSTSTVRGASLEGIISNGAGNRTFVIQIPAGTKYLDLTHTPEKEMLFGRDNRFEILPNGVLKLLK